MKMTDTHRLILLLFFSISFFRSVAVANEDKMNDIILLWPSDTANEDIEGRGTLKSDRGDGQIRVTNISTPSLQYFPAPVGKKPVPMVILCPGGGYAHLVVSKMVLIAEWLNGHGISACVLKYRAPQRREDAFQDIQRAVRIVRARASEWNLDPSRIGVMGSSAGGHLAARASTSFHVTSYKTVDEIDKFSCRPDFTVLLYPAYMNQGEALRPEFTVSDKMGPTLIISAKDDKKHFPGSPVYAKALEDAGASIRVHYFEQGGHGFGLRPEQKPLSTWPDLSIQWLKDMGILEEAAKSSRTQK